jgi:hypothetical protein
VSDEERRIEMKITMFAVRTNDLLGMCVRVPEDTILVEIKRGAPIVRVDADPQTDPVSGKLLMRSPAVHEVFNEFKTQAAAMLFEEKSDSVKRGELLKELLLAVEGKTDAELAAVTKVAKNVSSLCGTTFFSKDLFR